MPLMDPSYQQQAQEEMWDAIAAQDSEPVTYRVRASSPRFGVVATGFATLREAQRARDKWERTVGRRQGIAAVAEREV